jgi:ssDNA-binding Zn-finger/Zn-ribbon topoisomerase 1
MLVFAVSKPYLSIFPRDSPMIQFKCPHCNKALRADESKSGRMVICSACKHKLKIPEDETELPLPEEEPAEEESTEEEQAEDQQVEEAPKRPVQRKKKKKHRQRMGGSEAARGRVFVIIICGAVLAMHLVSLINYLASPDPAEMIKKQAHEFVQKNNKGMDKDFEKQVDKEIDKITDNKEMQASFARGKMISLIWMLASFCFSAILLTFLYLQHDWARVFLGVLFMIGAFLGVCGLVFGGLTMLRFLGTGKAILAILEMIVRVGVTAGFGVALLGSESIAAYTKRK